MPPEVRIGQDARMRKLLLTSWIILCSIVIFATGPLAIVALVVGRALLWGSTAWKASCDRLLLARGIKPVAPYTGPRL